MTLKERIQRADLKELAEIALSLMKKGMYLRDGSKHVIFDYEDVKCLFTKHRPNINWADMDEMIGLLEVREIFPLPISGLG